MSEVQASIEDQISAVLNPQPPAEETPPVEAEPAAEAAPVEDASAAEPEPEAKVAEPDEDTIEVDSLDDLADHFNIPKEDLYGLKVPVSIDGKRVDVSLSEWKDGYVSAQDSAVQSKKMAEERAQLEQRRQVLESEWEARVRDSAAALSVAEQQLLSDFNGTNWDQLREDDPAEWSARRQLMQERKGALDSARRDLSSTWEQQKAQQAQEQQMQMQATLETERAALVRALPEWANEETASAERSALSDYLQISGFAPDEVQAVSDHRLVIMARKAMLYDKEVGKANAAKKRVVRIGKRITPGARITPEEQKSDASRSIREKLRKTGRPEDAVALIAERIGEV